MPVVGLFGNWNVVEALSGLFFGAVYPDSQISKNFTTLKNGYSILIEKRKCLRVDFIWFSVLFGLIN